VAKAETLFKVPAGAFVPPPKVESAVVRITPLPQPLLLPEEERPFRLLVQGAFGMRRKQMRRVIRSLRALNVAQADAVLEKVSIDPELRPETLSPEQFAKLLRALATVPESERPEREAQSAEHPESERSDHPESDDA
jgi:16S rRNA (adenine1518-N6/adenine1519-N6)-dimethyltransferase